MKRWRLVFALTLAASVAVMGCHKSTSVSLTIAPPTANVLINNTVQFTPTEAGSTNAVTWSVGGVTATSTTPGGTDALGHITSSGLYTAPATVPSANPQVIVTAAITDTSSTATATLTIQSGVQVSINGAPSTIGTGENFQFTATVTGVPAAASIASTCRATTDTTGTLPFCNTVTWTATSGTFDSTTNGLYHAPSTGGNTTVTVTATSIYDTTQKSVAVFTLVGAMDPTLISVGPHTGTRGATFEDVYLSGTNFISTTRVFITVGMASIEVPTSDITVSPVTCSILDTSSGTGTTFIAPCTSSSLTSGSTILRVRVTDQFLAQTLTLPTTNAVQLKFSASRQSGSPVSCSPTPSLCQVTLNPQSPVLVGLNPNAVPLGGGGVFSFTVDGGFYGAIAGTSTACPSPQPLVTAQFSGQAATPQVCVTNTDLQMIVNAPGSLASQPGLYQLSLTSDTSGLPPAFANLAVKASYTSPPASSGTLAVGAKPWAVAINTATGLAVVVNRDSNDLSFIDMTATPPVLSGSKLCTGGGSEPSCTASAPTGVAIDNIRNVALVVNSATDSISVVNLATRTVSFTVLLSNYINNSTFSQVPVSIGINPTTGTALLAFRGINFGLMLDLTKLDTSQAPVVKGIVNMGEGANPRIAVSTKLNWALVTPGGLGTLEVVNLGQQSSNIVSGTTVSGSTVTVTTSSTHTLAAGEPVLLNNVGSSASGVVVQVTSVPTSTTFTYTTTGLTSGSNVPVMNSTIQYGVPLATFASNITVTGVAINEETSQAIFTDPSGGATQVSLFSLLDESSISVPIVASVGTIGAAFNPLDDIAVVINQTNSTGYVIDPIAPTVLNTFTVGSNPWDLAIDPGTDTAVVINQGDNAVSIVPLGALRSPQILEVQTDCTAAPADVCGAAGEIFLSSTLTSLANPTGNVNLKIIGSGFISGSVARVDGTAVSTTFVSSRLIQASVPASMLNTAHLYGVDVDNPGAVLSNISNLRVIRSISVSGACSSPAPTGTAVDAPNNFALVTDSSCGLLYVLNMSTGLGNGANGTVSLGPHSVPIGVAVSPQGGSPTAGSNSTVGQGYVVAVANSGSNTVSLVDDVAMSDTADVAVDAGPTGVAIDAVAGQVVVTANGGGTVDVFPTTAVKGTAFTTVSAGQGPIALAISPELHVAAVGNSISNTVSLFPLVGSSFAATSFSVTLPLGIVYDPISTNFLVTSSLSNSVIVANPTTSQITAVGVGINPTSIAYNFATGTLVTANSFGHNMTVVDFVSQKVREVFPMTSSGVFSVAIDPETNVAVVADSANQRILFVPLP